MSLFPHSFATIEAPDASKIRPPRALLVALRDLPDSTAGSVFVDFPPTASRVETMADQLDAMIATEEITGSPGALKALAGLVAELRGMGRSQVEQIL